MYDINMPNEIPETPVTADRLLRSIGATERLTGFEYAVFMVDQIVNAQSGVHLITKQLYPETAEHFGVKPYSVERALRTLISSCWKYGSRETLSDIAGSALTQAPSNSDFLDMLAATVKQSQK